MYASPQVREDEIEQGADRTGLQLQVDLDTSAESLTEGFASLDQADPADDGSGGAWDTEVELRGGQRVVARLLPLARLTEVVLHHVDLDIGFEVTDVDDETAEWLLEWSAYRLGARDEFPRLELVSDTGFHTTLGSSGRRPPDHRFLPRVARLAHRPGRSRRRPAAVTAWCCPVCDPQRPHPPPERGTHMRNEITAFGGPAR